MDSNDATELFIYSGLEPNINTRATGSEFLNAYELSSDYSGQEFKFYKNGILRKSGTLSNEVIESGDYYVNDTNRVIFSDDISEDGIVPDASTITLPAKQFILTITQWGPLTATRLLLKRLRMFSLMGKSYIRVGELHTYMAAEA